LNGAADEARSAVLKITATITANRNVICPSSSKQYLVYNATSGAFTVTLKTLAGTGVVLPQGAFTLVYCDGTNVIGVDNIAAISSATAKSTPIDADTFGYQDSVSGLLRSATWANFKATLKTYFDTLYLILATVNSFTKAQRGTPVALASSAASIAIDLSLANNFTYTTSENTTLAAPTNAVAGQSGVIVITQGATARTLAYNTFWKFAGGTVPTLTATIGAVDVFAYYVDSASRATCNLVKDVQ
jgi:hypothetical protein